MLALLGASKCTVSLFTLMIFFIKVSSLRFLIFNNNLLVLNTLYFRANIMKCPRNVWHVKKGVPGCHVTVPKRRHMGGRKSSRSRGAVTAVSCSMDSDDENVEEVVEGT